MSRRSCPPSTPPPPSRRRSTPADLTAPLKVKTTYADICYAIRHASETYMKGIIGYTADQVVSTDLIGNSCPCIFDETAGIMLDNDFVKLIAWYDNEWGYSNMVVRLLEHMVAVDEGRVMPEKLRARRRSCCLPCRGRGGHRRA